MHLHEMAIDREIWNRREWSTYDQMCNSLVLGHALPGGIGPGQPVTVQGLAVGFNHASMDYQERSLCAPCDWVSAEAVNLAAVVHAGLLSVSGAVSSLGSGPGKPAPFASGMWGWHVAECWTRHIIRRVIAFGPMAAWHRSNGWHFVKVNNATQPKKYGLGSKVSSQPYQQ